MTTILIFGAAVRRDGEPSPTLRRRVEAALAAASGDDEVRFIPTGARGCHGPSEASVMARLLTESGVRSERILLEESGTDTLSSVRAVRRLIRQTNLAGPVLVASSTYHLPRCLALLCLSGISARPCSVPKVSGGSTSMKNWYWWLREIPAIPYDVALLLWSRLIGRS